jgi:tRNA(Leu) C34 or U34 (ribose-2'-O)-methylase TrmL
MENFFNYLTKPILPEDVLVWFEANNIIYEKLELFSDFSLSLYDLIIKTYLGESDTPNDTKITLTEEDKEKHFDWCWVKLLNNFEKEGIIILGNEGNGIRESVKKHIDFPITIPKYGSAESLNVATAGAIILGSVFRCI